MEFSEQGHSYHQSPTVEPSPDSSTMTPLFPFCSQSSLILASFPAGLCVVIHHLKHNLANILSDLSLFCCHNQWAKLSTLDQSNICLLCPWPWLLYPTGGKGEKSQKSRIGPLQKSWSLSWLGLWCYAENLLSPPLLHSIFYTFLKSTWSPPPLCSADNQKRTFNYPYPLPLSLLTKMSATHTPACTLSQTSTVMEGVSFSLCSGALLSLLSYKLFLLFPKPSDYFFQLSSALKCL